MKPLLDFRSPGEKHLPSAMRLTRSGSVRIASRRYYPKCSAINPDYTSGCNSPGSSDEDLASSGHNQARRRRAVP